MDKQIHLQITDRDISLGKRGNPNMCPIALALKRCTGAKYVSVGWALKWQMPGGNWYESNKDWKMANFIYGFDRDRWVQPFERTLIPAPTVSPEKTGHV